MSKIITTAYTAIIGQTGSATLAGAALFSATGKDIAILTDELFLGDSKGHLGGAEALAIKSHTNPVVFCLVQSTSSEALGGSEKLNWSTGATAAFSFQRLKEFCGYAVGNFSSGAMNFAYSFAATDAGPFLKLHDGKKFMHRGPELELVNR